MALTEFVTDAVVGGDVAAALKSADYTTLLATAPFWSEIIALQHQQATNLIYARLAARGYDNTQIPQWDLGPEVERCIALYWTLVAGGMLEAVDDKLLQQFKDYTDPEKGLLVTVLLTIDGVGQNPTTQFGTAAGGSVFPTANPCHWAPFDYGFDW